MFIINIVDGHNSKIVKMLIEDKYILTCSITNEIILWTINVNREIKNREITTLQNQYFH